MYARIYTHTRSSRHISPLLCTPRYAPSYVLCGVIFIHIRHTLMRQATCHHAECGCSCVYRCPLFWPAPVQGGVLQCCCLPLCASPLPAPVLRTMTICCTWCVLRPAPLPWPAPVQSKGSSLPQAEVTTHTTPCCAARYHHYPLQTSASALPALWHRPPSAARHPDRCTVGCLLMLWWGWCRSRMTLGNGATLRETYNKE